MRCRTILLAGLIVLAGCDNPTEPQPDPGAAELTRLAAGAEHTCGLTPAGAARCWGRNLYGALGNGNTFHSGAPVSVSGDLTFAGLSAGGEHTCGITAAGDVYCWGRNNRGQLGTETARPCANVACSQVPVAVSGGHQFASVSAGNDHTCGVTRDGEAYCWGAGTVGQLGNGARTNSTTPVLVSGGLVFQAINAGSEHTCGITRDGEAYCWGNGRNGQLGDGAATPSQVPVAVAGSLRFRSISAGPFASACGVATNGRAYCWGVTPQENYPESMPRFKNAFTPLEVSGASGLTQVVMGNRHACALTSGGAAYCWGMGLHGQLGTGTHDGSPTAVPVSGSHRFTAIAAGAYHTCGMTADARVYCWGENSALGLTGVGNQVLLPTQIPGFLP